MWHIIGWDEHKCLYLLEVYCKLEISGGNLFDLLTTQGSIFSTVFVVKPALAYGCVNTNLFVVPMTEQLHIQILV